MKQTPPPAGERVYVATCDDGNSYGVAIQRDESGIARRTTTSVSISSRPAP